ncbi:MAG: hypothetical protein KDB82_13260 [Planctomycetes bacterium]|nr:hypothetical protein [Planctomycetota bacterium]
MKFSQRYDWKDALSFRDEAIRICKEYNASLKFKGPTGHFAYEKLLITLISGTVTLNGNRISIEVSTSVAFLFDGRLASEIRAEIEKRGGVFIDGYDGS